MQLVLKHYTLRQQQGFGMLEALISIVVFAGGILGIASMQLNGLSLLSNSNSLNVAVLAAADMADRMRANTFGLVDGHYMAITGNEADPACGANCTSEQIAQRDAFDVMIQLNETLNNPTLSVRGLFWGVYTIEITWVEKASTQWGIGNTAPPATQSHAFTFLPEAP